MMIDSVSLEPPAVQVVMATDSSRWGVGKSTSGFYASGTGTWEVGAVYLGAEINNADYGVGANNEVVLFGGVNTELAGFDVTVGGEYRKMNGSFLADDEAVEVFVTASRGFGPITARATLGYSPDDFAGEKDTVWVEGGASTSFGGNTFSGAYGRKSGGFANSDYTAWNVGVSRDLTDRVGVDVRYFDTDQETWGEPFGSRIVASLTVKF